MHRDMKTAKRFRRTLASDNKYQDITCCVVGEMAWFFINNMRQRHLKSGKKPLHTDIDVARSTSPINMIKDPFTNNRGLKTSESSKANIKPLVMEGRVETASDVIGSSFDLPPSLPPGRKFENQ